MSQIAKLAFFEREKKESPMPRVLYRRTKPQVVKFASYYSIVHSFLAILKITIFFFCDVIDENRCRNLYHECRTFVDESLCIFFTWVIASRFYFAGGKSIINHRAFFFWELASCRRKAYRVKCRSNVCQCWLEQNRRGKKGVNITYFRTSVKNCALDYYSFEICSKMPSSLAVSLAENDKDTLRMLKNIFSVWIFWWFCCLDERGRKTNDSKSRVLIFFRIVMPHKLSEIQPTWKYARVCVYSWRDYVWKLLE